MDVQVGWHMTVKQYMSDTDRFIFAGITGPIQYGDFKYLANCHFILYDKSDKCLVTAPLTDLNVAPGGCISPGPELRRLLTTALMDHMNAGLSQQRVKVRIYCKCITCLFFHYSFV